MLMLKLHRSASFGDPIDAKLEFPIENIKKATPKQLQELGKFVLELTNEHVDISPYEPQGRKKLTLDDFTKQLRKK